jgi:hypothetical protein
MRPWGNGAALGLVILAGLALPGPAGAASDAYLRGSLSVAGVVDDNLFATPAAVERDRITRYTPEIEAGWRSARLALTGRYARDAEVFEDHPDLDTTRARQNASLDLEARPGPRIEFSLRGAYQTTTTPGELNLGTGISAGRAPARRVVVNPSIAGDLGPATSWSAGFTQTLDDLSGGVAADTRVADLVLEHQASPRSRLRYGYAFSRFDFDTGGLTTAHTLTLGWSREMGPRSDLELRGGPRFSEGTVDPEVSVTLRRRFRRGSLSLAYARSLATVIGQAGAVESRSFSPVFSWKPWRHLEVSAAPALHRIRGSAGGPETEVRALDLQARGPLGRWLSLAASYQRTLQAGVLAGSPGGPDPEIERSTFLVSLVARSPDRPRPAGAGRKE